jgi:hypothetical protein
MTTAQREQQIQRVKAASFQPELDEALEQALRASVIAALKVTLEAALNAEVSEDRSGPLRQSRRAEERVILAALAVWEEGSYEILHYEIAGEAGEAEWSAFFSHLMERGLPAKDVQLVVSDGSLGLPKALKSHLLEAKQQRCITHKVRGVERHLSYQELPETDEQDRPVKPEEAKRQRRSEIKSDANIRGGDIV